MMLSSFEPEGSAAATNGEMVRRVSLSVYLILVAVAAPIGSHFGFLKPDAEQTASWVMRPGALVTVLALLAEHNLAEAVPRLTNDLRAYLGPISWLRKIALLEIIFGTDMGICRSAILLAGSPHVAENIHLSRAIEPG
jgi:hypothetical protein